MKNSMIRVLSVLMVAVMLSTAVISGVFAAYSVADDATVVATVSAFGVTLTITQNAVEIDSAENKGQAALVPGGSGELATVTAAGTASVAATVTYGVTATVTGAWVDAEDNFYCPIVLNVFGTEIDCSELENADAIVAAVAAAAYNGTIAQNASAAEHTKTITWTWKDGTVAADDNAIGADATITIVIDADIVQS